MYTDEYYPMLAALAYLRRWLDGFLSIIEGYLLTFSTVLITLGISMSMFDYLTGGVALNNPTVFTVWAGVQTIAIDAQFINMWFRCKVALRERRFWLATLYLFIGLMLACVTFAASVIPAIQKSLGISFNSAIVEAGINPIWMLYARYSVVILLGIIGAFSRTVVRFDDAHTGQKAVKATTQIAAKSVINHPSWFAQKWAGVRYSFQLRRAVKQAIVTEKQSQTDTQIEAKSEPDSTRIDPQMGSELSAICDSDVPEMPLKPEVTTGPIIAVARITTPLAPLPFSEQFAYPDSPVIQHPEPFHHADYTYTEHKQASGVVTRETVVNEPETIPVSMPISVEQITEESKSLKQPSHPQNRYTAKEAARLEICKSTGVKSGEITKAIASGELTANREGLFSKTALENWLKSRRKVAA